MTPNTGRTPTPSRAEASRGALIYRNEAQGFALLIHPYMQRTEPERPVIEGVVCDTAITLGPVRIGLDHSRRRLHGTVPDAWLVDLNDDGDDCIAPMLDRQEKRRALPVPFRPEAAEAYLIGRQELDALLQVARALDAGRLDATAGLLRSIVSTAELCPAPGGAS